MKKKRFRITLTRAILLAFLFAILATSTIGFIASSQIQSYIDQSIRENNNGDNSENKNFEEVIGEIGTRVVYMLIGNFIVGIILILTTEKRIIKPIRDVSNATKKVSKGNFDINIETTSRSDEIGELVDNFNKMTKGLKQHDKMQKSFISNVSHELKTPISAIQGVTQLLKSNEISMEEKEEYIDIIAEETTRLSNLSSSILRLSKIENQEVQQNIEEYDLTEQIRKSILLLEPKWAEKEIEFDINMQTVMINAEKELLQQVWINILENAIKFSNNKGKIKVSSKIQEKYVLVEIEDNGIGIEEEKLDKIFNRFYQADSSHAGEGSGLGLSIVKRIIELCEGDIKVESKYGKGSKFIISLPI